MQNIDHKGLCVECDNVGHLGAIGYSHICLYNLVFKVSILCVLEILFIGSATTVREKNVPVFGKFVVSRLQFRQFCFDLKEKVDILKPGFWATK